MKQQINILTVGVDDPRRSMQFYQDAFDWKTKGVVGDEFENGAIVIFELDNGMNLSLYERKNLAWDSNIQLQPAGDRFQSLI